MRIMLCRPILKNMGDFPFNTLLHLLPKKHMPPRSIAQVTFWDDSSLSFYENNI